VLRTFNFFALVETFSKVINSQAPCGHQRWVYSVFFFVVYRLFDGPWVHRLSFHWHSALALNSFA
jgi:hypothetical protein